MAGVLHRRVVGFSEGRRSPLIHCTTEERLQVFHLSNFVWQRVTWCAVNAYLHIRFSARAMLWSMFSSMELWVTAKLFSNETAILPHVPPVSTASGSGYTCRTTECTCPFVPSTDSQRATYQFHHYRNVDKNRVHMKTRAYCCYSLPLSGLASLLS
jgi:hypothetical protein